MWQGFIHRGTNLICSFNMYAPPLSLLSNVGKASYTMRASIFVDVPYWPFYSTDKFFSCVVSGSFTLVKISQSHGLVLGEYGACFRVSHCQRRKRSVTAAAVWLLALSSGMMGFCTSKCRHFLLSSCDYDLFAKVKEPLRGTRYNKRDEVTRAVGRSIRNNKDGRADGVRRFPNFWQKVINKVDDYIEAT